MRMLTDRDSTRRTGMRRRAVAAAFVCLFAAQAAHGYNLLGPYRWDPSVWGPGETLVFHLSSANWPEWARLTPEEMKDLLQERFDEWSASPRTDMSLRVELTNAELEPARDGKNIFYWSERPGPGTFGNTGSWYERENGEWWRVEADHWLGTPESLFAASKSDYDSSSFSTWVSLTSNLGHHGIGHLLGFGHAGTFPVSRHCPGPPDSLAGCRPVANDMDHWRGVSGTWPMDSVMSYGVSGVMGWNGQGGLLRLDDRIGASVLRPSRTFFETTGAIAGSILADGKPVRGIHVWALRQTEEGLVDGVGSFADENGEFHIQGLPPGDWILLAHPDLEWMANPGFFYERQGEFLDVMLLRPVRAAAGQTTRGIEINMLRGRKTAAGLAH